MNLYDLMDSAYGAPQIKSFSKTLGHVSIIDQDPRRGEKIEWIWQQKRVMQKEAVLIAST